MKSSDVVLSFETRKTRQVKIYLAERVKNTTYAKEWCSGPGIVHFTKNKLEKSNINKLI